jgi:UDP-2,4-diacetamido-2,4,6-trideoxy-beta-L-altropyranose hydrolase
MTPPVVVFRADASLRIGSGHVMRCLTLADALKAHGVGSHFICREHAGNLIGAIRDRGHTVTPLAVLETAQPASGSAYAAWLGAPSQRDAEQTRDLANALRPRWLVVDHYALEADWERRAAPPGCRVLAIDDLANRPHACDLLLDQNLGRQADDYRRWVPGHCQTLIGPRYALLRPEFARLREYSLQRRAAGPRLQECLITMGGMDPDNATGAVLNALRRGDLPDEGRLVVVMGARAPWLEAVRELAADMPIATEVVVGVNDMAERMARADLAIGAAGSTSWERCCLGLPTLLVVLADNQRAGAHALEAAGAAQLIGDVATQPFQWDLPPLQDGERLMSLSRAAAALCDGHGVERVVERLQGSNQA